MSCTAAVKRANSVVDGGFFISLLWLSAYSVERIRRTAVSVAWRDCMPAPNFAKLPDEFLTRIATVVVRWNMLEDYLNMLLIHLLGKPVGEHRSHIVFTHMAFPQRLDVLGALAEEVANDPAYSQLHKCKETLLPLLRNAQQKRNQIIHSSWGFNPKSRKVFRAQMSARGVFKLSIPEIKIEELDEAITSINIAADTIYDLAGQAWQKDALEAQRRTRDKSKTP